MKVKVHVPATTANLGPGFDCLALALDLWNEGEFSLEGDSVRIENRGEGKDSLLQNETNIVFQAYLFALKTAKIETFMGLKIKMRNRIPISSGLGSSAAAIVMGLLAAKSLHSLSFSTTDLLRLAAEMEGHADNAAAALLGGLVVVHKNGLGWLARSFATPQTKLTLILPKYDLPTHAAREALPASIPMTDAVFNISGTALVLEALRDGDMELLKTAMEDQLHEPFRMKLIPGLEEALLTARKSGAAAAISGAGPGMIVFANVLNGTTFTEIQEIFRRQGIQTQRFDLQTTRKGAWVEDTLQ